jgi:hypothetical protein
MPIRPPVGLKHLLELLGHVHNIYDTRHNAVYCVLRNPLIAPSDHTAHPAPIPPPPPERTILNFGGSEYSPVPLMPDGGCLVERDGLCYR